MRGGRERKWEQTTRDGSHDGVLPPEMAMTGVPAACSKVRVRTAGQWMPSALQRQSRRRAHRRCAPAGEGSPDVGAASAARSSSQLPSHDLDEVPALDGSAEDLSSARLARRPGIRR